MRTSLHSYYFLIFGVDLTILLVQLGTKCCGRFIISSYHVDYGSYFDLGFMDPVSALFMCNTKPKLSSTYTKLGYKIRKNKY